MTDPDEPIDIELVRSRLPSGWTVESDGERAIYGYPFDAETATFPDPAELLASFGIRQTGELWTAVWLEPNARRGGRHEPTDHVTGLKERCIEWVSEKADSLEEFNNE